jgi:hypothetical protein
MRFVGLVRSLCDHQPYLYLRTAVVNMSAMYFGGLLRQCIWRVQGSHSVDKNSAVQDVTPC